MIAARLRRARAALWCEETHDARFVRAVCGKDAQPGVQGDFTRSCMTLVRRYFICAVLCAILRSCGTRAELVGGRVCAVALSCVTLVRGYLSLRSCLRSCGQVLGTPILSSHPMCSCRLAIIDSCQKQLLQISFHVLSFQKI